MCIVNVLTVEVFVCWYARGGGSAMVVVAVVGDGLNGAGEAKCETLVGRVSVRPGIGFEWAERARATGIASLHPLPALLTSAVNKRASL